MPCYTSINPIHMPKKMPVTLLVAAVVMILIFFFYNSGASSTDQLAWHELPTWVAETETSVQKAYLEGSTLYIVRQPDGTRQDGYAEYLCQAIHDHAPALNDYPEVVILSPANEVIGRSKC